MDQAKWHVEYWVHKYRADSDIPYEILHESGNMLVYGGSSALWEYLIDGAGATTPFNNTNAFLGVGNGNTPALATHTDLQGVSTHREAMDATFPTHTDGTGTSANAQCTWKSTYETGDANFAWLEWGIFNASTAGRMLNRKVTSLGTKTSADTWSLTVTITLT